MVLTMLPWSCRLTLVLVFLERKVNKPLEVQITLLVNSNSWNHFYSSTEEKPIGETHTWFYISSTRTSFMLWLNSTSVSSLLSQDKHCTNRPSINCIMSLWLPRQSCGSLASTSKRSARERYFQRRCSSTGVISQKYQKVFPRIRSPRIRSRKKVVNKKLSFSIITWSKQRRRTN